VRAAERQGSLDILSDTQGVDFGPYLARAVHDVRTNWYACIPDSAALKKGNIAIEFAITKDGSIASMKLVASSGDLSLDRAAWAGITASSPFPRLPLEFKGEYLALRFRFYYNPDRSTNFGEGLPVTPDATAILQSAVGATPLNAPGPSASLMPAVLLAHAADSMAPKYPKKARQEKTEGLVRLDVDVGKDGKVKNVRVLEGDPTLADASVHAIRKWRFYPAQKDGKPVEDRARIRVDFRLSGEQVRAQVVSHADPSPSPAP
jgi:TonB family protein